VARKVRQKKDEAREFQKQSFHLLDQFSQSDLHTWRYAAAGIEEYYVCLFYHLEGLRQLHIEELCNALRSSGGITQNMDGWCRIVDYSYSLDPLSAKGSLISGGRFNIGTDIDRSPQSQFPALYCAENYKTAYLEKFGASEIGKGSGFAGHEFALRSPASFSAVRLNGTVNNIFDLRSDYNLKSFVKIIRHFDLTKELKFLAKSLHIPTPWLVTTVLHLKKTFLQPEWRNWPAQFGIPSNPQVFGNLLRNAGFEGVLYPSSKGNENCLAIFLDNLTGSDSFVELADEVPAGVSNTRLDSETWRNFI